MDFLPGFTWVIFALGLVRPLGTIEGSQREIITGS
jgi:hypothetical protein